MKFKSQSAVLWLRADMLFFACAFLSCDIMNLGINEWIFQNHCQILDGSSLFDVVCSLFFLSHYLQDKTSHISSGLICELYLSKFYLQMS